MSEDTVIVMVCDYCNKIADFDKEVVDGEVVRVFTTACICGSRTFVDIKVPNYMIENGYGWGI